MVENKDTVASTEISFDDDSFQEDNFRDEMSFMDDQPMDEPF